MKKDEPMNPGTAPAQPVPAKDQDRQQRPPVSSGMIWTFWGAVAAALVSARVLDAALPQVPERVIERWVMVAFAAFLAAFLIKLK